MDESATSNATPVNSSRRSGCIVAIAIALIPLLMMWSLWKYLENEAHRAMTWLLPEGAHVVRLEDHEPGIAADGFRLRVFFDSPEGIETWKTKVSEHTRQPWRACPADARIQNTHYQCPESLYQKGGQFNLSYYEDGVLAEVFYVSPNGECWWYEHW